MRQHRLTIVALALVIVIAVLGLEKLSWRFRMLQQAFHAGLPEVTWTTYLRALAPSTFAKDASVAIVRSRVNGNVRLARFDPDAAPCEALWDTTIGPIWAPLSDEPILEFLIQEQESGAYQNQFVAVNRGDVVVDVGAHLGVFTRNALQAGAEVVVAVEPDPTRANCLQKTFADQMAEGKVILAQVAAWHEDTWLNFRSENTDPQGNSGMSQVTPEGTIRVKARTIDDIVRELPSVDFIKMDIEGAERNALRGAALTLKSRRPKLAICVYHRSDDPTIVPEIIRASNPAYEQQAGEHQHYFR